MLYNGYFTHPDLWMMWFSIVVSAFVALRWVLKLLYGIYIVWRG